MLIAAATLMSGPVLLAFRIGAGAGRSGGPENLGSNCTSCHEFDQGLGRVEVLGLPERYRSGVQYDLTVRIGDPERVGAGFELSAEAGTGHAGTLALIDTNLTQFASGNPSYVTHTEVGVDASIAGWAAGGGSYDYAVRWQAPVADTGPVDFFASGNAINNANGFFGDHYYFGYHRLTFAVPGDGDGDGDVDLFDIALFQQCYGLSGLAAADACLYFDTDGDAGVTLYDTPGQVGAMDGPVAAEPAALAAADAVRGGKLYDRWWTVVGLPAPQTTNPLYPDLPFQSGAATNRCKECHGWDYKGAAGQYGSGPHYTGIPGVVDSTLGSEAMFRLLRSSPDQVPNGHDMAGYGLADEDIWDLVSFLRSGVIDPDLYLDQNGAFVGSSMEGIFLFQTVCGHCHGTDGTAIDFSGGGPVPEYVGTVATDNPWEFMHKVRHGDPGASMPPGVLLRWTPQDVADIGAFCQTLPTQ
ncbi:MAG: choice-of-anchor V domain-containing protein [Phycisphaerae bacterium]